MVEVLKHEMAHQYAHEILGARDESAHGEAFRTVCQRLGIDASGDVPQSLVTNVAGQVLIDDVKATVGGGVAARARGSRRFWRVRMAS